MPITVEQIEEAFGYPLLTHAQHKFMTQTMRHHVLTPWYHATQSEAVKDAIDPFGDKAFSHGDLFYFTLERVQSATEEGVYLEPREDSPRVYGQEALVILAERVKEELGEKRSRKNRVEPMNFKDVPLLEKVVHLGNNFNLGMCIAFGQPYVDKGLEALPDIVSKQIEFLQTLESEKA